jgi:hypothetical protein
MKRIILPAILAGALAVSPASAAPVKFRVNGHVLAEGQAERVAGQGNVTLANSWLGSVRCHVALHGFIENQAKGGAGRLVWSDFHSYWCETTGSHSAYSCEQYGASGEEDGLALTAELPPAGPRSDIAADPLGESTVVHESGKTLLTFPFGEAWLIGNCSFGEEELVAYEGKPVRVEWINGVKNGLWPSHYYTLGGESQYVSSTNALIGKAAIGLEVTVSGETSDALVQAE